MGFMANGTVPASDITNDGFWPDINVAEFASSTRLDGTVSPERMRFSLTQAMIRVNHELNMWKRSQTPQYLSLSLVPAETIGGVSTLQHLYLQAVYSEARALLTEHYRDFDSTKSTEQRARTLEPQIDAYRAEVRQAISQLTGKPRTVSELI